MKLVNDAMGKNNRRKVDPTEKKRQQETWHQWFFQDGKAFEQYNQLDLPLLAAKHWELWSDSPVIPDDKLEVIGDEICASLRASNKVIDDDWSGCSSEAAQVVDWVEEERD